MKRLKKGQILYVDSRKYTVVNMIEFKEDSWLWQEYEVVDDSYEHKWLSLEKGDNGEIEYYIYENYRGNIKTDKTEFYADNKKYTIYEKGRATVNDYFGNADVDKYEVCDYYDYISEDEEQIISIEKWEGEAERTIGTYLDSNRVQITQEMDRKQSEVQRAYDRNDNFINIFWKIGIGAGILIIVAVLFMNIFANKSIEKYLKKQTSKYNYVTSVTNNTNNKKAKVYESSFSTIDSTVKDIIDGVPKGITKTSDSEAAITEDGIGLQTNREYAYIYEEEDKIYIQVSSKQYVNNSGTMYHTRHHNYYYRTYTTTNTSSIYDTYAYSARQKSTNSRILSGGGTSSGK